MIEKDEREADDEGAALRHAAEARLQAKAQAGLNMDSKELPRLVHELQVHRIELEMQNSALQQTRAELEAALALYTELYDFAPVGYLTLTPEGLIAKINLTGARLLGVERAYLLQQHFASFVLGDDQGRWARHFAGLKRREANDNRESTELSLRRGDGSVLHVQVNCVRPETGGDGLAVCVERRALVRDVHIALIDITARKQVEAERTLLDQALEKKNVELERAKAAAETANLAKSDFLSSMSHELRTPLSAILGFAQLMESGSPPPTPSQARSIDQILKGGWYLLDLINEILDLALIESGKLSLSLEPVALAEVMRECESMIAAQAGKRDIVVNFSRCATPLVVNADRMRVKQVLINLLSNAVKYNKAGGSVNVECALGAPHSIRVSVSDTGAGLTPAQIAQLFQPFNRLGQEAKFEQGTGIGLVVCKHLVESMGGVIGVDSAVGQGSVFWVELPVTTAAPAAGHQTVGTAAGADGVKNEGPLYTLLYVEDNPANLMLVRDLVARRPEIRLLSAIDGNHGVALARAALPDVILMDINLPGISGLKALKVLAEDPATAHIPVIALSANAMSRDIERGREAGFFRYLTKPIKVNEFMATLDVALEFSRIGSVRENIAGKE